MPLPKRYEKEIPEMTQIWSAPGTFRAQTGVWGAQIETRSEMYGVPPAEDVPIILEALVLSDEDIEFLITAEGHETNRLLRRVQSRLTPEQGNHVHKGDTSNDILDTSLALQARESIGLLVDDFQKLGETTGNLAIKHREDTEIGRTHTQHGMPQTFGRQLVGWYAELQRGIERLHRAKEVISYGKLSGEVGTSVFIDPELEERTLAKLGLKPDEAPTQVISRDRHAELIALLAINSGTLARMAENLRLLSMTEVGEVRELGEGPGSSSMPHKRNPELSERIKGLHRRIKGAALEEMDAMILWLERDISHSSTERFTFPDAFGGLAYSVKLMRKIMEGLVVNPEQMAKNLELTNGAIYSNQLLNLLIDEGGMARTEAYELAKALATEAMESGTQFVDLAVANPKVKALLSEEMLRERCNPQFYLKNIDVAYKRTGLLK